MKKSIFRILMGLGLIFWLYPSYASLTKQDIEEIRKIVKEEIQHVDKRIDSLDKRIDDLRQEMNTRIDSLQNLLYVILAGIFGLVGFVLWDRRSALAPAVRKAKELEEREERIERALKEYAFQEPR
ncbi:MAG: prefoldin domain-containing protein, partial [bacterium]